MASCALRSVQLEVVLIDGSSIALNRSRSHLDG